jgi:hypothetical protein
MMVCLLAVRAVFGLNDLHVHENIMGTLSLFNLLHSWHGLQKRTNAFDHRCQWL